MSYHGDSVGRALVDLFPEIGLDLNNFKPKCIRLLYLILLINLLINLFIDY